jgi:hypothetical protein
MMRKFGSLDRQKRGRKRNAMSISECVRLKNANHSRVYRLSEIPDDLMTSPMPREMLVTGASMMASSDRA